MAAGHVSVVGATDVEAPVAVLSAVVNGDAGGVGLQLVVHVETQAIARVPGDFHVVPAVSFEPGSRHQTCKQCAREIREKGSDSRAEELEKQRSA